MQMINAKEKAIAYFFLTLGAVIAIYPLYSIVNLSLTPKSSSPEGTNKFLGIYFGNFVEAWQRGAFNQAMLSSLFVSSSVVLLTLICAILAGYAFALMRVPFAKSILVLLLFGLVMPYEGVVISLYEMMTSLHLLNTYWALILPQVALSMPFAVLWIRTFFSTVPKSIIESASLDGASRMQSLRFILVPLAKSAIGTLATLLFLFTWNEFLLALVLVPSNSAVQTVPLSLSFFAGNRRNSEPPVTAAAAVLVALPIVFAYLFLQRRLIRGIISGAVKE
jgi:raffinose/stachyose/melibiose transport system permease protein